MGTLDAILRYKQQKDAEKALDSMAIPNAVNQFIAGRQQQQKNALELLTLDAALAKSGLRRTEKGIARDTSLLDSNTLLKQQDLVSKINKRESEQNILSKVMENINGSSVDGDIPPGTTVSIGGVTIPINPKLTESEQSSVAGVQSLEPILKDIEGLIGEKNQEGKSIGFSESNSGIIGDVKRTAEQLAVDSSTPLLVSKSDRLSTLQSKFATLKKTLPFTEGGKQLTTTEKKQVFALLNTAGKDDKRIEKDLNEAMSILRRKEKIALGGANAAKLNQRKREIPEGTKGTYQGKPVVRKGGKWVLR